MTFCFGCTLDGFTFRRSPAIMSNKCQIKMKLIVMLSAKDANLYVFVLVVWRLRSTVLVEDLWYESSCTGFYEEKFCLPGSISLHVALIDFIVLL